VSDGSGEREGVARGIDAQGALQLELADGRCLSIIGGEVTVRRRGA
jgi:biotin-(acetyl-CoA carboxylase) ligase